MKKIIHLAAICLAVCYSTSYVQAQCSGTILAQQDCNNPGTQIANNENLNTGITRWNTGTNTITGVNFNGGTLVVCGNMTLGFGSVNSGNIIIQSGATLTINSAVSFNSNFNISNYGTLNFSGSVSLQNNNNTLANASSTASINFGGNNLTLNGTGSAIINNGSIGGINAINTANGNGTICMGQGASMAASSITNSGNSHTLFSLGSGVSNACLRLTGTYTQGHPGAGNHNNLSASSNLKLCIPGSSQSSVLGSNTDAADIVATINTNCTSCSVVMPLPLQLVSFTAQAAGSNNTLCMVTANEKNIAFFEAERSTDGKTFSVLGSRTAPAGNSSEHAYYWNDEQPAAGVNYYRVKITELDGTSSYSGTAMVNNGNRDHNSAIIFPNPAHDKINIRLSAQAGADIQVSVADLAGRQLYHAAGNTTEINIAGWQPGMYVVRISINGTNSVYRFIKS